MRVKNYIAISDNGFIFDSSTGSSYNLNAIGLEIIQMIELGKTEEEIIKSITEKYDVEQDIFEKDFYDFLSMLKYYNLIDEID